MYAREDRSGGGDPARILPFVQDGAEEVRPRLAAADPGNERLEEGLVDPGKGHEGRVAEAGAEGEGAGHDGDEGCCAHRRCQVVQAVGEPVHGRPGVQDGVVG